MTVRQAALGLLLLLSGIAIGAWFAAPSSPDATVQAAATWTCSMHPAVQQPSPGDCPICGMDLVLATAGPSATTTDEVVLSDRARALARLRTTAVVRQPDAAASVRLLGTLEPDESTQRAVTAWVAGRIDRLHVNTTGERLVRGQMVATLYSPEVYAAHQDLLTATQQVRRLQDASSSAGLAAAAALRAARDRLSLLGIPAAEVDRMATADTPARGLPIRSPFAGTVIERVAVEGAYVETGAPLYRVAQLDQLWAQLDAYEADLARLEVGQPVALRVEGRAEPIDATVSFIEPTLDPRRRTARVRVAVDNPAGDLRPGLFVEALVRAPADATAGAPLVIPDTAPLFTGRRSIVYVERDTPAGLAYTPRTVRLGPKLGDVFPVVAGLSEGERVVSRGAFAIDADLQIQGGASMMAADDDVADPWAAVVPIADAERARLAPVLTNYLAVQRALAEDDLAAASSASDALTAVVTELTLDGPARSPWNALVDRIRGPAAGIGVATTLEGARGSFEPLSGAIAQLLRTFGNPLDAPLHLAHCPMANSDQGARWVQQGTTIDNAYFGARMRTCGDLHATIAPGAHLPASTSRPASHTDHDH